MVIFAGLINKKVLSTTSIISVKESWKSALSTSVARFQLIGGSVLLAVVLSVLPSFFNHIEKRKGVVIDDAILALIPAHDVSLLIFAIIWGMGALTLYRAAHKPAIFVTYAWAYSFMLIVRFVTISMVPLNPPVGLIQLTDPLTSVFYGHATITKDLFFSGHTSTLLLMYLTLEKKTDRILGLLATIAVGILLLVQHVHYSFDVLMAPVFIYPIFRFVKLMLGNPITR